MVLEHTPLHVLCTEIWGIHMLFTPVLTGSGSGSDSGSGSGRVQPAIPASACGRRSIVETAAADLAYVAGAAPASVRFGSNLSLQPGGNLSASVELISLSLQTGLAMVLNVGGITSSRGWYQVLPPPPSFWCLHYNYLPEDIYLMICSRHAVHFSTKKRMLIVCSFPNSAPRHPSRPLPLIE